MKKVGLSVFAIAFFGSLAAVWAITGITYAVPSFNFFNYTKGSGNIVAEKRDIRDFTGVDASGAMRVEITVGKEFAVELEGDDNILPLVETSVRNGVLHFERSGGICTENRLIARISLPELDNLEVSGATAAAVANVNSEDLKIRASGASKIEINGAAADLDAKISGASKLNADNLQTARAKVRASGASKAAIFASESVDADASGASRIIYSGNPTKVKNDASGASKIAAN